MNLNQMSDARLVKEIQQGNETAFNELYERYHKLVYYVAFQMTNCEADAEEIKQEVFIKVIRHINDIKDAKSIKYWLTTITHNECKHLFRSNKDKGMDERSLDLLYLQQEKRREFLPEEQAHYQGDMEVLSICMKHLNAEQREVIALKYFAQLSIDEISQMLRVPNGTVKSRLANAKKSLRIDVENYCRSNDVRITFRVESLATMCALMMMSDHERLPLAVKVQRMKYGWEKCILGFAIGACVVAGGVLLRQNWMPQDQYESEKIEFNAKQTYTQLKQWAHCDEELKEKSEAEKASMRPLYEELKANGNLYYVLLEQSWKGAFQ